MCICCIVLSFGVPKYSDHLWYSQDMYIVKYMVVHVFSRQELDGIAPKKEDRFPSPFQVLLGLEWDRSGKPNSPGISWQNLPHPTCSPLPPFSSVMEQEETMKQFCKSFMYIIHVHSMIECLGFDFHISERYLSS